MTGNSTFWHKLFWSGSRGTVKCDQRKRSLRGCAFQTTFCQGGQRLKYTGRDTKQWKGEQQCVSAWLWKNRQGIPSDSDYCDNVMRRADWPSHQCMECKHKSTRISKATSLDANIFFRNYWRHTRYFVYRRQNYGKVNTLFSNKFFTF